MLHRKLLVVDRQGVRTDHRLAVLADPVQLDDRRAGSLIQGHHRPTRPQIALGRQRLPDHEHRVPEELAAERRQRPGRLHDDAQRLARRDGPRAHLDLQPRGIRAARGADENQRDPNQPNPGSDVGHLVLRVAWRADQHDTRWGRGRCTFPSVAVYPLVSETRDLPHDAGDRQACRSERSTERFSSVCSACGCCWRG